MRTISDRIAEVTSATLVGRRRERGVLAAALAGRDPGHLVVFVHGPGGIGKTHLVRAALADAEEGTVALALDCRDVEPIPKSFLEHVADAVGSEPGDAARVAAAIGAAGPRVVLALDTYEAFGLMDSWLRQDFLPYLPDHVVTIVSGRDAPKHGWLTTPGWSGLVVALELRPLPQSEAMLMLRERGIEELDAARLNRFTRGHPLAIELAAAAAAEEPGLVEPAGRPPSQVMLRLLDAVCASLEPETRELLEAACTVRRVNEPILRVLRPDEPTRAAFAALERLPFVERHPQGLLVHDVVRDALARDLAERDPELYARRRAAAARHFQEVAGAADGEMLWDATLDLIFMLRNPYVRECCFPSEANEVSVERAEPGDGPAIAAVVHAHEPPDAAAWTLRWWERHPEAFRVARSSASDVAALYCLIEVTEADPRLLADDPVAARWMSHMAAQPLPARGRVLLLRRWLGEKTGELPSSAVAAAWLSLKRDYMERRPDLARLYSVVVDLEQLGPIFVPLGFAPCGDSVRIGGVDHVPVALDFGPLSVDGWLAGLVDSELEATSDRPGPVAGGPLAALSERELEVLLLVAEGASNREIGARLVISDRTAGRHVANIFAKLGVHSRAEAARIAAEAGLTGDGG